MIIRILKEWKNGDEVWPEGQLLEVAEKDAQRLIGDEVAEKYVPNPKLDVAVPSEAKGNTGINVDQMRELLVELRKGNQQEMLEVPKDTQEDLYLATGGFKSMSHFARDVYKSTVSNSMTDTLRKWGDFASKQSGLNEGVGADGGFAVPTEFRSTLLRNVLDSSILLNRCQQIPMATNSVEIPTIKETTRAAGTVYGGVQVYRVGEGQAISDSKPTFSKVRLQLVKLAAVAYVTSELLEDSPITMEPLLTSMFSEAIAFQVDDDILHGTGAGSFMGVLNAPALVSQAKENNQVAATINTQNVLKMWSRLKSRSQGNALWVANQAAFPQLAQLALEVGAAGAPAGLLQTATNGVTGSPIRTLLGAPLILTEHCSALGTKGDIVLGDYRQYLIGQKAGGAVQAASSIHLKFLEDETAFRFTLRMDGKPWEQSALTPKRGTPTLGSFVTLNERA